MLDNETKLKLIIEAIDEWWKNKLSDHNVIFLITDILFLDKTSEWIDKKLEEINHERI